MLKIQWNLDITNLYITKTFVERTIFFTPAIVKCMKKNLDKTKPRYSEQILPFPWPFVISRFHSIFFFQLPKLNKYCLRVELAPLHQVIKKAQNGSSVCLQAVSHFMPQRVQNVIKKKKTKRARQLLKF